MIIGAGVRVGTGAFVLVAVGRNVFVGRAVLVASGVNVGVSVTSRSSMVAVAVRSVTDGRGVEVGGTAVGVGVGVGANMAVTAEPTHPKAIRPKPTTPTMKNSRGGLMLCALPRAAPPPRAVHPIP